MAEMKQQQKEKSTMKAFYPMALVVNATKPIITGLALAVAMMFLPHDALATPNGTSILHFAFKSAMTNTGVDPDASGNVNGNLIRQGNANSLLLTISLAKLDPNTTYQLAAIIGDDTSPTSVTNFTTTSKGAFAVKYVNKGRVAGGNPLPDVLSPLCSVRELDIVNGSGQTVLRSDLTDPDSLQYSVNSFMANTGFIPNAVGRLQINATKHHTQFRLTASGLTPNTAYVLMINGNAAQTNATDRVGKLKLTVLPPGSTDVLGINMLALTDSSGNNVVLTTNGLGVPCDTTAPTVSFTVPAIGATGVATNQKIAVTFSEAMDPLTITTATFTLKQGTTAVTGTVSYVGVTAIFTPATGLAPLTTYTATITTGARDLAGNALATAFVWSFTTGTTTDTTRPTVSFIVPANAATGVAIGGNIAAAFSEAMDPLTISTATFTLKQGTTVVTGTVSYAGVTATFNPLNNLAPSTTYTATITTGARDLAGNALAAAFVWSFETGATPNTTPPTVSSTVPANAATGVAIGGNIAAVFSEAMDPLTISTATFTLKQGTTVVTGTVTYAGVTATFNPLNNLAPLTTYTATITTGARDLAGNALATAFVWSFTTGAAPDTTRPTVSSTIPTNAATGVAISGKIAAVFSEAMDPLTISTASFTLKQGTMAVTGTVSYAGVTATFNPTTDLAPLTTYTATITTGAKDLASNALATNFVWSFTTGTTPDTTPPTVSSTVPANGASDVSINQTINATFSEDMDPLTISTANFMLTGPGATAVTGTVTYVAAGKIATFTPMSNLAPGTTYTAMITTGAKDLAGNALAADYVWSFSTGTLSNQNQATINLGSASTFAIMATAAISGGGDQINGDVGLDPGSAQGIPPSEINGTIHVNDQAIKDAQTALLAAYNDAVSRSVNAQTLEGNLGGLTKTPGLYVNGSSTGISGTGTGGILTLDAQGDANAVFIFKMASTLVTDPGTSIVLSGGAQAKNVYWQVGSSATLGTTSIFKGNILAFVTITVNNGAAVEGRLFAGSGGDASGAVTVQSSTITVPAP